MPAGTLVTVYENPSHSPTGQPFVFEPYKVVSPSRQSIIDNRWRLSIVSRQSSIVNSKLRMYMTMATWCVSCKRELPQLQRLRDQFQSDVLQMYGVPIDSKDVQKKLTAYVAQYKPAYKLLTDLTTDQTAEVQTLVKEELKLDGLPATIITDGDGYVLRTMWNVPSESEVRQLLAELPQ